ncbi:MAG: T9SS type A sorting domain-containing protein [Ignavibacteriaceae bacterium]|jgi:probable HAF family extracellular repeat protein|nr:T9SS type A sorting domain-containing protein [Ignavibacteriaceae bacterium]
MKNRYCKNLITFFVIISIVLFNSKIHCQSLTWLGTLGGGESQASAVSLDGSVVVGISKNVSNQYRAFKWTQTSLIEDLGTLGGNFSSATGLTYGGSIIVGVAEDNNLYNRAFYKIGNDELVDLGVLSDSKRSSALAISGEGSTIVGYSEIDSLETTRAFKYSSGSGMLNLGTLGGSWSEAYGVSGNGDVVVGVSLNSNSETHAFIYANGVMQSLGTLGGSYSRATSVSDDGLVVVGYSLISGGGDHAFRWTSSGGMQNLGTLGGNKSEAWGVSGDGSVIVGMSRIPNGQSRAFRWTASAGMEDLNIVYANLLSSGSVLNLARAISFDGRFIVGTGFNSSTSRNEGFLLFNVNTTDVQSVNSNLPIAVELEQNFPNPFNPSTTISFSIPTEEFVTLKVFNSLGEEVAELVNETKPAGNYSVSFDAANLSSGIYFYKITAGNFSDTKKMIILK